MNHLNKRIVFGAWLTAGWLQSLAWMLSATSIFAAEAQPLSAPFDGAQAAQAQRGWAGRTAGEVAAKNSLGMTMMLIPPGSYRMGNQESSASTAAFAQSMGLKSSKAADVADESPRHLVRITRPIRLARHEVTLGNFKAFVQNSAYRTEAETDDRGGWGWDDVQKKFVQERRFTWRETGFPQSDDHPVVNVSWNDAQKFCEWLGKQERQTYRLPTEAEWEYATRAGTESRYSCGDDPECLATIANVADATARDAFPDWPAITGKDGYIHTSPVGSFQPNPFGLFDTHGNVWEWCDDVYDAQYYADSPADDPRGPEKGALRVSRGGAFSRTTVNVRCSVRRSGVPTLRHVNIGFRPALVLSGD